MAGGGVKGGLVHGATDDIGHKAVEKRTSVHDFHGTYGEYVLGKVSRVFPELRHAVL